MMVTINDRPGLWQSRPFDPSPERDRRGQPCLRLTVEERKLFEKQARRARENDEVRDAVDE